MRTKQANRPKKLTERGPYVILPILGDELSELRVGTKCLTTIIFCDANGNESQLVLEAAVTLARGDFQIYLDGSRPGATFNPTQLHPLLDLLGSTVVDARASRDGSLEIAFSNKWLLRIVPESGYEAWHFQSPRPGEPAGGDVTHCIMLHGDHGRLIC